MRDLELKRYRKHLSRTGLTSCKLPTKRSDPPPLGLTLSPINNQALGIPGGCAILESIPYQMETPHAI